MHKKWIGIIVSGLLLVVFFTCFYFLNQHKDLVTEMPKASITTLHFEKAFTHPFEPARWVVEIQSEGQEEYTLTVVSLLSHLDQPINTIEKR